MSAAAARPASSDDLNERLLDPAAQLPPIEMLRQANLGAYAYAALAPNDARRAELRPDYLRALASHQAVKRELQPLIAAWNEAGIVPLLFKGFALSEFVYPAAGMRYHGDVDVLVAPEEVTRAKDIAVHSGWSITHDTAAVGLGHYHNAYSLHSPSDTTCVDLHRWLVHAPLPFTRIQRRLTRDLVAASHVQEWEGVRVRKLAHVDAVILLMLQRAWGDGWGIKPHDRLDLLQLSRIGALAREDIRVRARSLGVHRAVDAYSTRIESDAWPQPPRSPSRRERLRLELKAYPQRGVLAPIEKHASRALRIHILLPAAVRGLRVTLRVRSALRRHTDLHELLDSLARPKPSNPQLTSRGRARAALNERWASRLFPHNRRGDCLQRSLVLFHSLSAEGWPVRFVSGVRRVGDRVVGHAWVELDGHVISELREPRNRELYEVNFEYPAAAPYPG